MAKTAAGLVAYAKAQLGKPYWWGGFGQHADAAVYASYMRQYPDVYTGYGDCSRDYGLKVHDCVGLVKGYLWCNDIESDPTYGLTPDVAVNGMYDACTRRGNIDTMPDIPGVCVFMAGLGHIGVYIGGGQVIEAMGHAYGVVQTQLAGRGWAKWGMPKWIDYSDAGGDCADTEADHSGEDTNMVKDCTVQLPTLRLGDTGSYVITMQLMLVGRGYWLGTDGVRGNGTDGDFGELTDRAVKTFQADEGLEPDGIIGNKTWETLLKC